MNCYFPENINIMAIKKSMIYVDLWFIKDKINQYITVVERSWADELKHDVSKCVKKGFAKAKAAGLLVKAYSVYVKTPTKEYSGYYCYVNGKLKRVSKEYFAKKLIQTLYLNPSPGI